MKTIFRSTVWLAMGLLLGAFPVGETQDPGGDASLEEKLGQMLLVGFRGTTVQADSNILRSIREIHLGGVVLFDYDMPSKSYPRNIVSPGQVRELVRDLQSAAAIPLLVAVDAEGGRINRLKPEYGFIEVPSAQHMGEAGLQENHASYRKLARQLNGLGFNLNLAPVVDLNLNPTNPVIGSLERSFSPDPENVIARAAAFIEEHRSLGVISTLKHFPGHGSSRQDSHLGLVDVTSTFQDRELLPYQELIRAGQVDVIMTAHIMNRKIDPANPATLSPRFLQTILRQDMGFGGVIISDDMQMGAISRNFGWEESLIKAVQAGCDILAIANNARTYDEQAAAMAHSILLAAVKGGRIPRSRIDASYRRILRLKQKYSLVR
ncbi:MAG: glycoside hydrolase family 3 protein [Candidatus Aminicenantaceae bacterium]